MRLRRKAVDEATEPVPEPAPRRRILSRWRSPRKTPNENLPARFVPMMTATPWPTARDIPGDLVVEDQRSRSRSPDLSPTAGPSHRRPSCDRSPTPARFPLRVKSPTPANDSATAVLSELFGDSPAHSPHTHVSTEVVPASQSPRVPVLPPV